MIADILGMTWWTLLIACGSFCAGIVLSSTVKSFLQK